MQVFKIYPQGFAANSYFLTQDEKTAVVIDPAQPRIADEAKRRGLTVTHVLLTHGHFDHIGGCAALQAEGAKVGCLAKEAPLALGKNNMADYFGGHVPPFSVDFTFGDGDILSLDGMQFLVIATPGHTAGGACFCVGDHLFTGDTLFAGDIGRSDLPTGSGAQLTESVRKLYAIQGDFTVCPGHGEDTTLEYERHNNGWVRC
ncbi:MAG TPA: MBL fold metallo-hydrolase [Firmicutes bacterium]|nr:MBL fold metallo-hydrolase [Bacillota bacterium]